MLSSNERKFVERAGERIGPAPAFIEALGADDEVELFANGLSHRRLL
jgi:hypothetical protein